LFARSAPGKRRKKSDAIGPFFAAARTGLRFAEMYQGIAKDKTGFGIAGGIQKKGYAHSTMTPMCWPRPGDPLVGLLVGHSFNLLGKSAQS
jgi:hypothetical protein